MRYKLIGSYYVSPTNSIWIKKLTDPTYTEVPFFNLYEHLRYQYITGDGTSTDLLETVKDLINSNLSSIGVTGTLSIGLNSSNCVYINGGSISAKINIRLTHPTDPYGNPDCIFLANAFRLQDATSSILITATIDTSATRQHGYGLYPIRYLMEDISSFEPRIEQSVPDNGTPQTIRTAVIQAKTISLRMDNAYPRKQGSWTEYDHLVDFMTNSSSGRPFRLYPDTTVTTPYAANTNPFGYETLVMDKDSMKWKPTPAVGNWYKILDVTSLKCWQWIDP